MNIRCRHGYTIGCCSICDSDDDSEFMRLRAEVELCGIEIERLRADAQRYQYLRSAERRNALSLDGPEAGVWCDCEDAAGTLVLLTEDDLDAAIDAAMRNA